MAITYTTSIDLGFKAPKFNLLNPSSNQIVSFDALKGAKGSVVLFMCNHCPYVIHILDEFISIANQYQKEGISFIGINSNDVERYPEDSPEKMKELALEKELPFPYLFDKTQEVAKAYDAVCTPDFAVFDKNEVCIYRGRMDDSTSGNNKAIDGSDLRNVLELLLKNELVPAEQFPSCGCSIKWKL